MILTFKQFTVLLSVFTCIFLSKLRNEQPVRGGQRLPVEQQPPVLSRPHDLGRWESLCHALHLNGLARGADNGGGGTAVSHRGREFDL